MKTFLVFPAACAMLVAGCHFYKGYSALETLMKSNKAVVYDANALLSTFPFLCNEPSAILREGNLRLVAGQYSLAASLFEGGKMFCSDLRLYYSLGFAYRKLGEMQLAESQYTTVESAFPSLLRPKYLLAKLFYDTHRSTAFREKAKEIISFKQKIQSREGMVMIQEIEQLYATGDKN